MLCELCLFLLMLYTLIKLTCTRCTSYSCLLGKTALVVGGDKGIGLDVALSLASRGCRVVIACRKGIVDSLQRSIDDTGNPDVIVKKLDLLSLASIRSFAKEINETEKRLHILINLPDTDVTSTDKYTKDGLHPYMQANYFGYFLLTHLLTDTLKKSAPSRVVFVSSSMTLFNNLSLENLNPPMDTNSLLSRFRLYANCATATVIMANLFAEKYRIYMVTANTVSPGLIRANFSELISDIIDPRKNSIYGICRLVGNLILYPFCKSSEEGAQQILRVAVNKEFETATGHFIWDLTCHPLPLCAKNRRFCKKIWEKIEEHVKLQLVETLI